MEHRKLIKFGNNSLIISIPRNWTERNNLKKGDIVFLNGSNDGLIISADEKESNEEKEISIDTTNRKLSDIHREINSAYINNYHSIVISGKDLNERIVEIKGILHGLIGLETIEHTTNRLVANVLISEREVSLSTFIRRIDVITRAMLEDSKALLDEKEYTNLYNRDEDVNRIFFLVKRIVKKALLKPITAKLLKKNPVQLLADLFVVDNIEKIADEAKRIARFLHTTKISKKQFEEFSNLYTDTKKAYLDVMKAHYNNDINLAEKVSFNGKELLDECDKYAYKHKSHDISRLTENLKNTVSHIRHMARSVRDDVVTFA